MFLLYSYARYLPYPVYDPVGDPEPNSAAASISPASAEDLVLLDAYSRAVIGAVDQVGPAVLHLQISGVKDGSGAAAGLLTGDVIVAVDGFAVGDVDELHRLMTEERVGKPLPITVLRLTQKLDVVVTPRESPPRAAA